MKIRWFFAVVVASLVVWLFFASKVAACGCGGRNMRSGLLSATEKKGLIHMAEEEKLAHDVYQFLYKK